MSDITNMRKIEEDAKAVKGKRVSSFLEKSKSPNIAKFLEEIREQNREYKTINSCVR
jgi:hypothetical protein